MMQKNQAETKTVSSERKQHLKIINAFFVLIAIGLTGNFLSSIIDKVVPGSVIGMIILFILLITRVVKADTVQETSLYLVAQLSLFILPGAISVMNLSGFSVKDIILFSLVAAVSTLLTMTVTALVTETLLKASGEHDHE